MYVSTVFTLSASALAHDGMVVGEDDAHVMLVQIVGPGVDRHARTLRAQSIARQAENGAISGWRYPAKP